VTSLFTLLSVLEVSCAMQDLSWEQRREACRRVGNAGWLISGQAGNQSSFFFLPIELVNNPLLQSNLCIVKLSLLIKGTN
jgi:hypothetical protein